MKKALLYAAVIALSSFTTIKTYELTNASANVNQLAGVHVYHDCNPVKSFKTLGSFTITICVACQYDGFKEKAVKLAKKDYPDCDAVIISGRSMNRIDVIKFDN